MANDNRVPAGVPTGGQFSTGARAESPDLEGAIDVNFPDRKTDAVLFDEWSSGQVEEALKGAPEEGTMGDYLKRAIDHFKGVAGDTTPTEVRDTARTRRQMTADDFKDWMWATAEVESIFTEEQCYDERTGEPDQPTFSQFLADLNTKLERSALDEFA